MVERNRNLFKELPIILHVLKHLDGDDSVKCHLEVLWVDLGK